MTILIAGAAGFLGSYLLKRLLSENIQVIVLKRTSSNTYRIENQLQKVVVYNSDETELKQIFGSHKIDIVVNTVTDYGRTNKQISHIVNTNLMFSLRLLETAIEHNVKSFINTDTLLEKNVNAYALSKNQFVQWMCFLSNRMQIINIKIEHMYGPLDDETKFVYWLIKQLKNNVEKIELTSGIQKRDFIYIDDIVDAYMAIIQNIDSMSKYEEFELGSGISIPVKEFINKIYYQIGQKQKLTTKLNFGAVPYRDNENMCMRADITKLLSLGWRPKTSIEDGIKNILKEEDIND